MGHPSHWQRYFSLKSSCIAWTHFILTFREIHVTRGFNKLLSSARIGMLVTSEPKILDHSSVRVTPRG
jgi:hypothetical protein